MDFQSPQVDLGADMLPPHLLSGENKNLVGQIRGLEGNVEGLHRDIDECKDRLKFMFDHLGNVKSEITNTQSLYEAKRREIETEDHMAQLAERERGRLLQEMTNFSTNQSELQERVDMVQNRIFQGNIRMDEFKAAMNYNQEELEQWDLARKQKEDDGQVLGKYTKDDESKIKDLNLLIEKLSRQVQQKKQELEQEVTETRSAQIELDKTAEDYKELHKERQYLLKQWEEAVKAMHRRDNAIKAAGDRYVEGKAWVKKRTTQLKHRAEFHQVEVANNKEVEGKIAQEERVLAKYRGDYGLISKHISELDDEVEVVKNTLSKALHDKGDKSARKVDLQKEVAQKKTRYQLMQDQHQATMDKLNDEMNAATDLEKQNQLVSELLAQTEQSMKALDQETTRIKEEQYHNSQALFAVRKQQTTYLAEISGAQAQGRNMSSKIAQLDGESFKQQELLYSIEFQVQQMERKVNRAKGERTEEEKKELQEKIEMLHKMFDDLQKQHKVLDLQVKRVGDELRQAKHDIVRLEKDKQRVTEEVLELTLENESCQIELSALVKNKEEKLVGADVLKLEVDRLKKVVTRLDQELLGLDNRKQQLAITVTEREMEIRLHHDVLKMEAKTAEEERRDIAKELKERVKQVSHLKNKYQVRLSRISKGDDDETSHAQHIVNTAKEREEFQVQGDTLDTEIKALERDLRKVDKTIALLKGSNAKYKHQFSKASDQDDEVQQKAVLQTKNKEVQSIVNRRANDAKEFLRTEMSKMNELQDRIRERTELEQKMQILKEGQETLQHDIREQLELTARYDNAVAKGKRTTEAEIANDIFYLDEQEKFEQLSHMIHSLFSAKGDDRRKELEQAFEAYNLEVPVGGGAGVAE